MNTTDRNTLISFVALGLIIAVSSLVLWLTRPRPVEITIIPPLPTVTPFPTATPSPILVYVTGAVRNPGQTVTLPAASRVQDAILAAGGTLPTADLSRVNLADVLRDGDQVHVPAVNETSSLMPGIVDRVVQAEALGLPTPVGGYKVNVNSARPHELQRLEGIGPVLAERIIAYREAHGGFSALEELMNVEGLGQATLNDIRGQVILN